MPATVQFLIGRAGTGKTRYIHDALGRAVHADERAALIVPEQFTYETERALAQELGGLYRVQVLSISRLSERAIGMIDKPFLSMQGRQMVIRRAAYRVKNDLTVYRDAALRFGFAKSMNDVIAQCKQACLTPEDLKNAAFALEEGTPLALKLHDIALIYEATQAYLDEHYIDSEDAQRALISLIPTSFLAGMDVYIDGFDRIDGQLYEILEAFMRAAHSLTITICMDPDQDARDYALFAPERRACEQLMERAHALGCTVRMREFHDVPPGKNPALVQLECELYAHPTRAYADDAPAVAIHGASDRMREVDALADAVMECARSGMRYRDMAIIAADMEGYAPLVMRAFLLRDIPLFLDARRGVQGHPMAELLYAALRAVTGGFFRADLFRIMKTGLAGVENSDAEEFENYCLLRGLMGGAFSAPFPEEFAGAERARATLMPPLIALKAGLSSHSTAEKTTAVYAYLEALGIRRQLDEEVARLREQGRYALMEEHAQVWGVMMEMLEQLHSILGPANMSNREYIEVFTEALSAYQVGIIPATADQVLLGDFLRTRSRDVRALFVLGCNEGLLPAPQQEKEFIDDVELQELKTHGFSFWGSTQEAAENDHLSIYRALSRANEQLWLGFSYADGNRELVPAMLIGQLKKIFPFIKESAARGVLPANERGGFKRLVGDIVQRDALTRALHAYFQGHPVYSARLARVEQFALSPHTPKSLGRPLAKRLYGNRFLGNVSQLEMFRTCPYKHFVAYGLRVKPRKEFREKRSDVGSFSHLVLDLFVTEIQKRAIPFDALTRDACDSMLDEVFPVCLEQYERGLLVATPRARVMSEYYMQAVRETAWALVKSIQAGDFTPHATEVRFGPEDALPPIELLDGRAQLAGVIDRVDVAESTDGGQYVRVVDYKTGDKAFRYDALYDGTGLQLPVYLNAAAHADARPAGMFYQPVKEMIAMEGEEDKAEQQLYIHGVMQSDKRIVEATEHALSGASQVVRGLKRNKDDALAKSAPVVDDAQMEELLHFALVRAAQLTNELLNGQVEALPVRFNKQRSACAYCDFRSVCLFDTRIASCRARTIKKMDKDAFFERIEGRREE